MAQLYVRIGFFYIKFICSIFRNMAAEKLLAFGLKTKIALSKVNCDRKTEFQFLKPLQYKSVKAAQFDDTLSILPTGYGKSLVFELLPRLNDTKALIISPLNAIIEEQTEKLGDRSIRIDAKLVKEIRVRDASGKWQIK